MPLIKRVTADMFEFAQVMSYMVNPVNCKGVSGAGLALEFRGRTPKFIEPYQAACRSKELRIGTILIVEDVDQDYGVIAFPTKDHFYDTSDKNDILRGLEALRDTLKQDKYKYASIGIPMLGTGCGKADYSIVEPIMEEQLSDLDATVFLSMSPERTELRPRYLLIAGPPGFGLSEGDKQIIDETIDKAMAAWGTTLDAYTGIVSGGLPGVDTYIGGEHFNKDIEKTFVHARTGKAPLVVKPNVARNKAGAGLHHSALLCEIADDVILFKPVGHNNNRLSIMQLWIKENHPHRMATGRGPRRVGVFGEQEPSTAPESLLVEVKGDD